MERVKERVRLGGHSIPKEKIERRYERGLKNLFKLYIPIDDTWSIRDTSATRSVEVVRFTREDGLLIFDEALWNRISS
jgi:predicted ABC-type ATPase